MAQGVAMGYAADLVGYYPETVFAEGSFTTMTGQTLEGFGHIVEFNLDISAERQNIRGLNQQERKYDPIVSTGFELSASFLWQYDITNDTIIALIDEILTNKGDDRASWCFKLVAKPDGSTQEFLYLTGVTVKDFSIALSLDDTIKVDMSFDVADIDDGTETTPPQDWGTADLGTDPTNSTNDPTTFSEASITTWGISPSILTELQDFSIDWGCNPILIKNYSSKSHIKQAQGAIDIGFSGSAFGDGTSMGTSGLINALLSDASGNIVVTMDGTSVLTITACSYNDVSIPVKEADLTVIDFSGEANTMALT